MTVLEVLATSDFGERVAEEEGEQLADYFIETDNWNRLYADRVDIVYGPKGSGKSALYSLLVAKKDELFDRGIILAPGENPRGATAFKSLVGDPPASEREFIALWKLYFACLISSKLDDFGVPGNESKELRTRLEENGLRTKTMTLQAILNTVVAYVKRYIRPGAVETGIELDPHSQLPTGVSAKIIFSEPSLGDIEKGVVSVDTLLGLANNALAKSEYKIWILLDRLDVAFIESQQLEHNALRALFHVYLDMLSYDNLKLKVFLRTDIWRRITTTGFREASHITRNLTIEWNRHSLLNLVMKRIAKNKLILDYYSASLESILLSAEAQEEFFYRIFPDQIEVGSRKPNTFDWMLGRTCDSTKNSAPREIIHLLNSLRDEQIKRLEVGQLPPEENKLFSRPVFKDALATVSKTRLEQTLYAEYPESREYIEKLRDQKTQYSIDSLENIWSKSSEATLGIAKNLVEIGFFEQRGEKHSPIFWVPLLYRDALDLVQGSAG